MEIKDREIRYLPDLSVFNLLLFVFLGAKNFELLSYSSFIFWASRNTLLLYNSGCNYFIIPLFIEYVSSDVDLVICFIVLQIMTVKLQ